MDSVILSERELVIMGVQHRYYKIYFKIKGKTKWYYAYPHLYKQNFWWKVDKFGVDEFEDKGSIGKEILIGKPYKVKEMKISRKYGWLVPLEEEDI